MLLMKTKSKKKSHKSRTTFKYKAKTKTKSHKTKSKKSRKSKTNAPHASNYLKSLFAPAPVVAKVELTFSIWGHGAMAGADLTRKRPKDLKTESSNIKVWLMGLKNAGVCSLRLDSEKSKVLQILTNPNFDMNRDHSYLKQELESYFQKLVNKHTHTRPYVYEEKKNTKLLIQKPNNDVWLYSQINPVKTGDKLYAGEPDAKIQREVHVPIQGPTIYFHKIVLLDTHSNIISSTHLNAQIHETKTISMYTLFQEIYNNIFQIIKDHTTHKSLSFIDSLQLSLYVYDDTCTYNDNETIIPFRDDKGTAKTAQTEFYEIVTPTPSL
jgi:hypothetical protein